jgi:pimeloyl-ACP methyl ester carboxylesterase
VGYQALRSTPERVLGVLESGAPDGKPIFFFPGIGISADAIHPDSSLAESLGVRVISIDRPGIGKSSRAATRTLLDWPVDVAAIVDQFGIDRFGVLGWSGGGPYAMACTYLLAARISVTGLVSSAPPFADDRAMISMPTQVKRLARVARFAPLLLRIWCCKHCRQVRKDADAVLLSAARHLSTADREVILDLRFRDTLRTSMIQGCEQGSCGLSDDILLITRPWGFRLAQLKFPVHLWHAEADKIMPIEVGRYLANVLDNCRVKFLPAGGHLSYLTHWHEILQTLAESMYRVEFVRAGLTADQINQEVEPH